MNKIKNRIRNRQRLTQISGSKSASFKSNQEGLGIANQPTKKIEEHRILGYSEGHVHFEKLIGN